MNLFSTTLTTIKSLLEIEFCTDLTKISFLSGFQLTTAGPFSRGTQGAVQGSAPVSPGSNYHGLANANGNVGFRRTAYVAGQSATVNPSGNGGVHRDLPNMRLRPGGQMGGSGLTAWGIITIIVVVIVIGFCGYYGIICYPLFADKGRRYDNMDGNSTTTTTSSPTRSPDFGKMDYEEEEFRGYPKLSSEKAQWAAAN